MEISIKGQLIIIKIKTSGLALTGKSEFSFPVGEYRLHGLVPKNGKQLSEFVDFDYTQELIKSAKEGCTQSGVTLIWLNAFTCHVYKGDHKPFERIGRVFDKTERSLANNSRYKSQNDVMVNCLDRKKGWSLK